MSTSDNAPRDTSVTGSAPASNAAVTRAARRAKLDELAAELAKLGLSDREQITALAGAARELPPHPTASGLVAAERAFMFLWESIGGGTGRLSPELVSEFAESFRLDELPPTWRRRLFALVGRKLAQDVRRRA